jgi:dihydroflavonol-4-reductase
VRRLVHFSSIEALVDEPLGTPVDEARPLVASRHYPPYARSKATGERYVREGLECGLDAIILYPTAIIGPDDYRLGFPNRGLLAICRGRLPVLIDGGFDWVDVRDVVEGALLAAELAPSGGRYILSGQWASLRDLAELAHQIWGLRIPRLILPMWLAQVGALFATPLSRLTGRASLYTSAALRPLRANPKVSHARATRDLGYQPRPLKETMMDTWRWFEGR